MTECPDDDTLAAITALREAERAKIADHAATCDSCRSIVGDLLGVSTKGSFAEAETLAAAPSLDTGLPPTIDRYRIERRIGAGAMGVVFSGYDPELARPVAIKVLRSGSSPERMKREAQALAQLAHPNVVAVYDVGEQDGSTFVAMALVDGDNLRTWLQAPRTTAAIIDAISQAARGLEVAHAAGIVHRDVKPDNIFVAKNGAVLVGDFGLARTTDEALTASSDPSLLSSSEITRTGALVGTPAYMAPEQADGEATAACDQFALCVTAWEALYGKRPFAGKTLGELVSAVRAGPPTPPRGRSVPSHVRAAIRRGLAADPKARHSSMAELVAALRPPRRWPLAVAGVALLATAGTITAFAMRADPEDACTAIAKPSGWTASAQQTPAATALLERILDHYAADWQTLAKATCIASARRELAAPVSAATQRCLEDRKEILLEIADHPGNALGLAENLEPIETCRGRAAATTPSPELATLQRDLARANVFVQFAPDGATDVDALLVRANTLDDPTSIAEANYLLGLSRNAKGHESASALEAAIAAAERANDARIRARSSALLAIVKARKDLVSEAILHRDAAVSAAARANDPVTQVAVERAKIELAFVRREADAEIAAYRRIEAIQIERFGDLSNALVDIRFLLAPTLYRHERFDESRRTMDLALAGMKLLVGESYEANLQAAILSNKDNPHVRVRLQEQLVEMMRRRNDPELVKELGLGLVYDYETIGDYVRALATVREVIELSSPTPPTEILLENGAKYAQSIAERTDDVASRKQHIEVGLAYLDQLPAFAQERDSVQAVRGRLLLLAGRPGDARPYLEKSLAAAEAKEPQVPFHIMIRSFALAQALWETGGARERERAIALAEQAERRIPDVRAEMETYQGGALLDRLEEQRLRIEAWRRTHK